MPSTAETTGGFGFRAMHNDYTSPLVPCGAPAMAGGRCLRSAAVCTCIGTLNHSEVLVDTVEIYRIWRSQYNYFKFIVRICWWFFENSMIMFYLLFIGRLTLGFVASVLQLCQLRCCILVVRLWGSPLPIGSYRNPRYQLQNFATLALFMVVHMHCTSWYHWYHYDIMSLSYESI